MHVLAIANQKGGVGKTTTTISLAGMLSQKAQKILLVDLDPHGSLSHYLSVVNNKNLLGSYELFNMHHLTREKVKSVIVTTKVPNIDIMPASLALTTIDAKQKNNTKAYGLGLVLSAALQQIAVDYNYVFIDCPPVIGVLMINALAASDLLLIPVQTEFLAINGLERMLTTLEMVQKAKKVLLNYLIVPTMYDCRVNSAHNALAVLKKLRPAVTWAHEIPIDTKLREASEHRFPISYFAPSARATYAYKLLLQDILKLLLKQERLAC